MVFLATFSWLLKCACVCLWWGCSVCVVVVVGLVFFQSFLCSRSVASFFLRLRFPAYLFVSFFFTTIFNNNKTVLPSRLLSHSYRS